MARPSIYSEELAGKICERLASGESLRSICRDDDMPNISSVFLWLTKWPAFSEQYARARQHQSEAYFEEMQEIATNATPALANVAKLQVDVLKWQMAKMAPKRFGDHNKYVVSGPDDGPVKVELAPDQAARALAFLLSEGDKGE
jgi:hypothetical protein